MPRSAACTGTLKWNSPDERPPPAGAALMRWLWFALGWVMVGAVVAAILVFILFFGGLAWLAAMSN